MLKNIQISNTIHKQQDLAGILLYEFKIEYHEMGQTI